MENERKAIQEAFGEVSALFMSQEIRGIDIAMPTEDLIRIEKSLLSKLFEIEQVAQKG